MHKYRKSCPDGKCVSPSVLSATRKLGLQNGTTGMRRAATLQVDVHDFGRREAIEVRAAGGGIGAYVFGVDKFADFHVR